MRKLIFALALIVAAANATVYGWNATGHKAISLLVYQQLTPAVRPRIDALLAKHPDYSKWVEGVSQQDRGRAAFLAASVWPDTIRNDPRFYAANRPPTPRIPGLPEGAQANHAEWHYIDIPFSPDGTPTVQPPESNALAELRSVQTVERMPEQMQVYLLPWIIHITEDVHQPLHAIGRFTSNTPNGDQGGNAVRLKDGFNLHSYWDGRLGNDNTDQFLTELAAAIEKQNSRPAMLDMDPASWVNESFEARRQVYGFSGAGTPEDPAVLSDDYSVAGRKVAFERAALAAYRLAEFLNTHFK
jgi:hypothetical protein